MNKSFSFRTLYDINDSEDSNIDVYVTLNNGKTYIATFFTIKNVISLMNRWKETGEYNGKYFWASNMFIIERLEPNIMEECIHEILGTGEFESIFKEI